MNPTLSLNDFLALSPLLIPLFGAVLILLIQTFFRREAEKSLFWTALITLIAATASLFFTFKSTNPLLTNWLAFDFSSRFFSFFFLGTTFLTILISPSFFRLYPKSKGEYYFFLLSALVGLILIGSSADFLTLFLGLEILSLSLYLLCGYAKTWSYSSEASLKYFLIGAIGAVFLLYGIALIYGALGTTRFDELMKGYVAIHTTNGQILFFGGIALVTAGLAFKASVVPFHVWAPDVYAGAPTSVTAFMAVGTKAAAFAAFTRLFILALPHFNPNWNELTSFLIYPTLVYANFVALKQTQLRRFFAYSGISHAGFLLIPIVTGTEDSLFSLFFYLSIYGLATFAAFSVLCLVDKDEKGTTIEDLKGFFYHSPFNGGVMILSLLTLAGIPPTSGFLAKLYIFKSAFEVHRYALVITGLFTAILAATYYLRIITTLLSKSGRSFEELNSPSAKLVGIITTTALLWFSIYPESLLEILNRAF